MPNESTEAWQDESNDPSADNPSRFDSTEEAIAWAQENGQGQLTTNPDGTITNRNGERMGYDSDGNLAPIPGTTPEQNNPFGNRAIRSNWFQLRGPSFR